MERHSTACSHVNPLRDAKAFNDRPELDRALLCLLGNEWEYRPSRDHRDWYASCCNVRRLGKEEPSTSHAPECEVAAVLAPHRNRDW